VVQRIFQGISSAGPDPQLGTRARIAAPSLGTLDNISHKHVSLGVEANEARGLTAKGWKCG
jgi:hypothetical protein